MKARGKSKSLPSPPAAETERHVGFSNEPGGFEVGVLHLSGGCCQILGHSNLILQSDTICLFLGLFRSKSVPNAKCQK
jgi:hypothetical protein